ncbi:Protein of unknown function [Bacillus mobilis]|nr:Protein of unknown function [Bacillus mobilis]
MLLRKNLPEGHLLSMWNTSILAITDTLGIPG